MYLLLSIKLALKGLVLERTVDRNMCKHELQSTVAHQRALGSRLKESEKGGEVLRLEKT